jgi:hypothetical protein
MKAVADMRVSHWVSCVKFTVQVDTNAQGVITRAAPIVRKFEGQPLANLLRWAKGLGGLRYELL